METDPPRWVPIRETAKKLGISASTSPHEPSSESKKVIRQPSPWWVRFKDTLTFRSRLGAAIGVGVLVALAISGKVTSSGIRRESRITWHESEPSIMAQYKSDQVAGSVAGINTTNTYEKICRDLYSRLE